MKKDSRHPNYLIVEDTPDVLCLKDLGPWSAHLTITNGAEMIVEELAGRVGTRHLEYYDSSGDRDRLLIKNGKFAGFAPARSIVHEL